MEPVDFSDEYAGQRTCLNGHILDNDLQLDQPEWNTPQPFCHKCGAKTITACPKCNGPLRGGLKLRALIPRGADAYCLHCGQPLPWTETGINAVREMAAYAESLNPEDRSTLAEILPELTAQSPTPKTQLAIFKMKGLLKKGGEAFAESAQKIFVDIASEAVKKALFPK